MIKQFNFKQFGFAKYNEVKWSQVLLCITNNTIISLVHTQLNYKIILFQAIQGSITYLFAVSINVKVHSLNVKLLYLTLREDPIRCYPSM